MNDLDFYILISRGDDRIEVSGNSLYRPVSVKGFDFPEVSVLTESKMQLDYETVKSRQIKSRRLYIDFQIVSLDLAEEKRKQLISFLNPKKDFTITVKRNQRVRRINCVLESAEIDQKNLRSFMTVKLVFLCPEPYFFGAAPISVRSFSVDPLLWFPLTTTGENGVTSGAVFKNNEFDIQNHGDAETGFNITLESSGVVMAPEISCGDKKIKILDAMLKGDVYSISTEKQHKSIKLNGVPRFMFDRSSVFFSLPQGSSHIKVTARSGADKLRVSLSFEERYLGI